MKLRHLFVAIIVAIALGGFNSMAAEKIVIHTNDGQAHPFDLTAVESITFEAPIDTEGLVAYYPFNGNAEDESWNGLNGEVHGAELTQDRHENANSAYHFNADSLTFIEVADNPLLNFDAGQDMTVVIWVRTQFQGEQTFISNYNGNSGGFAIAPSTEEGYALFYGRDPDWILSQSETPINDGGWHMLVGMRQGTVWSIWVDSVQRNSTDAGHSGSIVAENRLAIGAAGMGEVVTCTEGDLDDIRIYKRALSAEEIQALYEE